MNVVSISEPGSIGIEEKNIPTLRHGEVLLRLNYVGFCGSDLSTYLGKNPLVRYPRIPGHEISGIIEKTDDEVPENYKKGKAVTVIPYTTCGLCPSCKRGRSNACQYNETLGVQRDGAMQEYLAIPWQKVLPVPGLSDVELSLIEPLTVGFHAVSRGRVTDLDTVAILGCGMIGMGAIIRSSLRGATVIAIDLDDQKLMLAKEAGAHYTINSSVVNLHEELQKITGYVGPDVTIEAVGNPATYSSAINEVAFTGRVVCIGYTPSNTEITTRLIVQKELDIMGSRNAEPCDFDAVISFMRKRSMEIDKLISLKVKPIDVQDAILKWSRDPGKIMKILLDLT